MQITILGCSNSFGVPVIGCNCNICTSNDSRNKRMRQSIYIEGNNTKILIDPGPDFRKQYIENNITDLDAILVTHPHEDHVSGFGDIRGISFIRKTPVDTYMDAPTSDAIFKKYPYITNDFRCVDGSISKILTNHIITDKKPFKVKNLIIQPFNQEHGNIHSLGFKINNFAYSTDFKRIDQEGLNLLEDIDLWIVEAMGYKNYPAHINVSESLDLIAKIRAKNAILIHMSHEIEYAELKNMLPNHVKPAYDGMKISI